MFLSAISASLLQQPGTIIFEGAQGILLDEWYGFHPYTTWSTTTFKNAEQLLAEQSYAAEVTRIGVMRAYATRHGPGPFVTEDAQLSLALPDAHNGHNLWQRQFRVGYLDLVATRYALDIAGSVDCLAVTHLDRLSQLPAWNVCDAYSFQEPAKETLDTYFVMQEKVDYADKGTAARRPCASGTTDTVAVSVSPFVSDSSSSQGK